MSRILINGNVNNSNKNMRRKEDRLAAGSGQFCQFLLLGDVTAASVTTGKTGQFLLPSQGRENVIG